jgi:hypothetical protein
VAVNQQASKVRQHTSVGEGMALGCLLHGVAGVTKSTSDLEWAFRRAWRDWPWAEGFPAVLATFPRNDVLRIIVQSPRRRGAIVAQWDDEGAVYSPVFFGDTLDGAGDVLATRCGVPLRAWGGFAEVFLARLGANGVRRVDAD